MRILRSDPLSLCEHRTRGGGALEGPNPERLQTAMSLYSSKLSALVMMVDGRVSSHSFGLKQGDKNHGKVHKHMKSFLFFGRF